MKLVTIKRIALAGFTAFFIGFLIHGPVAGNLYLSLANIHPSGNEKFADMIPKLLLNLLAQFVTAFVLAVVYAYASSSLYIKEKGRWGGVILGVWLWFGFLVTSSSVEVIWMGRDYRLWLFEVVSSFVVVAAMGAIIADKKLRTIQNAN